MDDGVNVPGITRSKAFHLFVSVRLRVRINKWSHGLWIGCVVQLLYKLNKRLWVDEDTHLAVFCSRGAAMIQSAGVFFRFLWAALSK
jgi:hypothetical protein